MMLKIIGFCMIFNLAVAMTDVFGVEIIWPKESKTIIARNVLPETEAHGYGNSIPGISDEGIAYKSAVTASIINALDEFAGYVGGINMQSSISIKPRFSRNTQRVNQSISVGKFNFNVRSILNVEDHDGRRTVSKIVKLVFHDNQGRHEITVQDGKLTEKSYVKYHDYILGMVTQGGFKAGFDKMHGEVHCELTYKREASD